MSAPQRGEPSNGQERQEGQEGRQEETSREEAQGYTGFFGRRVSGQPREFVDDRKFTTMTLSTNELSRLLSWYERLDGSVTQFGDRRLAERVHAALERSKL